MLCTASLALLWISPSGEASSAETTSVRIDEVANLKVLPISRGVRMAGDVNGDGIGDAMVEGLSEEGLRGTWVLFGPLQGDIELTPDMSGKGFFIDQGPSFVVEFGGACDVNGDGLSDIILGASEASNNGRSFAGSVYVVFGKADHVQVDAELWDQDLQGDAGFRIDGAGGATGRAAAPAGDINDDGLCDIAVASPFIGATYIVFGKSDVSHIDLLDFHSGTQGGAGYLIDTPSSESADDYSVAGAGDVNSDGIPDIVVGILRNVHGRGNAYVVYGKTDTTSQTIDDLGDEGFRFAGALKGDAVGYWVDTAGDVNGDGFADVLVGRSRHFTLKPGGAFVIYGGPSRKDLNARWVQRGHTRRGFLIKSTYDHDGAGEMIAPLGDVTGDGRADLAISAWAASVHADGAGAVYVIKGHAYKKTVVLSALGTRGTRIDGVADGDQIAEVAGNGDIDGDGLPDLLIGEIGPNRPMNVWGIYGTTLRDLLAGL